MNICLIRFFLFVSSIFHFSFYFTLRDAEGKINMFYSCNALLQIHCEFFVCLLFHLLFSFARPVEFNISFDDSHISGAHRTIIMKINTKHTRAYFLFSCSIFNFHSLWRILFIIFLVHKLVVAKTSNVK